MPSCGASRRGMRARACAPSPRIQLFHWLLSEERNKWMRARENIFPSIELFSHYTLKVCTAYWMMMAFKWKITLNRMCARVRLGRCTGAGEWKVMLKWKMRYVCSRSVDWVALKVILANGARLPPVRMPRRCSVDSSGSRREEMAHEPNEHLFLSKSFVRRWR